MSDETKPCLMMTAANMRILSAAGDAFLIDVVYDPEWRTWDACLSHGLAVYGSKSPQEAALALARKAGEFAEAARTLKPAPGDAP